MLDSTDSACLLRRRRNYKKSTAVYPRMPSRGRSHVLLIADIAGHLERPAIEPRSIMESSCPTRLPFAYCRWFLVQSIDGGFDIGHPASRHTLPIIPAVLRRRRDGHRSEADRTTLKLIEREVSGNHISKPARVQITAPAGGAARLAQYLRILDSGLAIPLTGRHGAFATDRRLLAGDRPARRYGFHRDRTGSLAGTSRRARALARRRRIRPVVHRVPGRIESRAPPLSDRGEGEGWRGHYDTCRGGAKGHLRVEYP